MIYVAIVEAVGIVLLVLAFLVFLRDVNGGYQLREQAWREERYELLERIRRPEQPPLRSVPGRGRREAAETPKDLVAYSQVGTTRPPQADPESGVAD